MKRTERRHLKDNELASLAATARQTLEERRGQLTAVLVGIVVIGAAAVGYFAWRGSVESRAHALLAEAIAVEEARVGPPPAPGTPSTGLSFNTEREKHQAALTKFKVVADEYPSTDAGLFARYREAATRMALGNPKEAVTAYQQVIDRSGDTVYGQMARLGQAQAQAQAGQFDSAITTFKEMSQRKDGPLPVDGILMQLGRAYIDAGKPEDAQQTFNRLVQEFPDSPFSGDAKRELDSLKKT
jgi:predicted Zn-dependent protease